MASSSLYLWPQEGLDYIMSVLPKGGTSPTSLYLGLMTTSWATVEGYGYTNINVTLNTGTYIVNELASATGYTTRPTLSAASWGANSTGSVTIGSNTISVRQSAYAAGTGITITNSSGSTWAGVTGIFVCTSATVGQASGAGTTVLWYAPFSDQSTVTLANGDSININPTWQSAPYPA